MKLACGNSIIGAMGAAVDIQAAHPANTFPAVMIEYHRFFIFLNKALIQDIEHLQKRTIRGNTFELIGHEFSL
jgi:hypothetical protein